jgi:hypothetical protein
VARVTIDLEAGILTYLQDDGTVVAVFDSGTITVGALADIAGASLLGRAAGSTGPVAAITAGTDGDVLRRTGSDLGFGTIATSSVTGLDAALAAPWCSTG